MYTYKITQYYAKRYKNKGEEWLLTKRASEGFAIADTLHHRQGP